MKKMNIKIKNLSFVLMAVVLLSTLNACKKDKKERTVATEGSYVVWLQIGSYPNTNQYLVGVNSLTSGTVSLVGNGAEVTGRSDYGIIPGNGFYYYHNAATGRFSKFSFANNKYTAEKEVPFTHLPSVSNYVWANSSTLILFGVDGSSTKVLYSIIDVTTFSITNGELVLPAIPTGYKYYGLNNVQYVNGKVFLAYNFTGDWPVQYPKALIAVLNHSGTTVTYDKTLEDSRSVGTGTSNLWMGSSVVDEKGDAYFMTAPTFANVVADGAIYRIKSGTTVLDGAYFFNIKTALGYNALGLWYLGSGKAIIKYVDASITGTLHNTAFAVIDLANGTLIKKITDLPKDKGAYLQSVVVENGKAYIAINAESGKDYVWEYDPATGNVKSGIEIAGGYDYILRVDKLR